MVPISGVWAIALTYTIAIQFGVYGVSNLAKVTTCEHVGATQFGNPQAEGCADSLNANFRKFPDTSR